MLINDDFESIESEVLVLRICNQIAWDWESEL